jgi:hypothetical protein
MHRPPNTALALTASFIDHCSMIQRSHQAAAGHLEQLGDGLAPRVEVRLHGIARLHGADEVAREVQVGQVRVVAVIQVVNNMQSNLWSAGDPRRMSWARELRGVT